MKRLLIVCLGTTCYWGGHDADSWRSKVDKSCKLNSLVTMRSRKRAPKRQGTSGRRKPTVPLVFSSQLSLVILVLFFHYAMKKYQHVYSLLMYTGFSDARGKHLLSDRQCVSSCQRARTNNWNAGRKKGGNTEEPRGGQTQHSRPVSWWVVVIKKLETEE